MTTCKLGCERQSNGNCPTAARDGLPVQCVGAWAADKHYYLAQYIGATKAVRARYLSPKGNGGAAFIDLFAGPGMVRVRDTGEIHDASPLIALQHREAPFSKLILCDTDSDNVKALDVRTASESPRVKIIPGDCNENIDRIASEVPDHGLNIALVDPFGLSALKFKTLEQLAQFQRMDLIVHFPTGDIKRNLEQHKHTRHSLTEALGADSWISELTSLTDVGRLIELFKERLSSLGYGSKTVRSEPIKNNQNVPLYHLVYASKSERGDAIWQSITKNKPSGQRGMGW